MKPRGTLLGPGEDSGEIIMREIEPGITQGRPTRRDHVEVTAVSIIEGLRHSEFLQFNSNFFLQGDPEHIIDLFKSFITCLYELEDKEMNKGEFKDLKDVVLEALERVREFYVQPQLELTDRDCLQNMLYGILSFLNRLSREVPEGEIEGTLMLYLDGEFRILPDDLEDARIECIVRASEIQVVEVLEDARIPRSIMIREDCSMYRVLPDGTTEDIEPLHLLPPSGVKKK